MGLNSCFSPNFRHKFIVTLSVNEKVHMVEAQFYCSNKQSGLDWTVLFFFLCVDFEVNIVIEAFHLGKKCVGNFGPHVLHSGIHHAINS